jgi:hypothetical protein
MTIPLPTSTSTTTSGASGATVTTVTVDIDLASALTWRGPRVTGAYTYHRRPWAAGIVEQFPGLLTGNSDKVVPTGSYVAEGNTRFYYGSASAKVARAAGGYAMPYTRYITRINATMSPSAMWAPLDAAGVASLQPGYAPTILGWAYRRLCFELPTLPSWAFAHNGIFSQNQNASGSPFDPLLQASNQFSFWYKGAQQYLSSYNKPAGYPFPTRGNSGDIIYDMVNCNPSGLTCLVWCDAINWTTGGATPTMTAEFQWYDAYGVAIGSPAVYGPWTTGNPVSGGGITTTGLAQDFSLGTLTPPANARQFGLVAKIGGSIINSGPIIVSLRGYDPHILIAPDPYPKYRIDEGGFIPGILIKP